MNVSVVGFGGIPIQGLTFEEAEKVLLHAVDRGINLFDSARGYTDSEEKIGRALGRHRDKIYLASKAMSRGGESMKGELDTSLKKLGTEMIDLYQLHAVGSEAQLERVIGPGGAYPTLVKAREAGKIRFIGITGHSRDILLKAVATGLFDTVQFPYNPIETEWEDSLIPAAVKAGMGTIGMKPVAGGAIHNVPLSIRFTLTRGMTVSIPGMDSIKQVDENVTAGENLDELTEKELSLLAEEKSFWGEQFCRRCGYCMPCPSGLNIPFLLLLEVYFSRYGLEDWARSRLATLDTSYDACTSCGECLEKCPYHLPIPELLEKAGKIFG